ncbi:MAG: YbaN family protein [Cohaesibacteraceae bacterium]|nr:YbaN family protein [Cohaesibacteraceae bacterium]MBL4876675.1 YbaN family protein [Cohaesibacteraceae bacterium]
MTRRQLSSIKKWLYFASGIVFCGFGILGVILPLLPTTVFLILAVACFARSSPKLERKLLQHPVFGPPILQWTKHGAISLSAKKIACSGMAIGYVVFYIIVQPAVWLALGVATMMGAAAYYVLTKPLPPSEN